MANYDVDLTVNDALALLLGLSLDHIRNGSFDFILDELERDLAQSVFALEDFDDQGVNQSALLHLQKRCDAADQRYEEGLDHYIRLVGEITRVRQNLPSKLILLHDNSTSSMDYSGAVISRASFIDWTRDLPSRIAEQERSDEQTAKSKPQKFTELDKEKHQITIAFLLELLQKKQGPLYENKDGTPNMAKIAADIRELYPDIDNKGYSEETLANRFSAALKTKREFI